MSHNLTSLFPQAHLDAMIAAAKELRGGNITSRNDAADSAVAQLLKSFPSHLDAAESYYTARQLEHMRLGVLNATFPDLEADKLVPFDTSPHEGAENFTVTFADQAGRSRVTKNMNGIVPNVDVSTSTTTYPMVSVMLQYVYTLQEARTAMMAGKPLNSDRAMRCREQIKRDLNEILLLGDSCDIAVGTGVKGLFTLSGTATYTTPAGASASKLWTAKTPTEILLDWNGSVSQVVIDSKKCEVPNTSCLPNARFEYVTTTRVGDGTSDTIATYFKRNNPHIKQIEASPYLDSHATAWTGMRMVNYDKSPLKVAAIIPVPFEQLSPDVSSTETVTKCHARTAGVVAMRPKSIIYSDEI